MPALWQANDHAGETHRTATAPPAQKLKRLAVVMTRDEVKMVFANLNGDRWLMISLFYGAGVRLSQCLRLRVQDVN
jgi:integrase